MMQDNLQFLCELDSDQKFWRRAQDFTQNEMSQVIGHLPFVKLQNDETEGSWFARTAR